MIALLASFLFVFYVVVPGTVFRFVTSLIVPLKKFHRTKTQEITFAVVASLFPWALTMILVWTVASWPFPTKESLQARRNAYHVVFADLYSDKQFDSDLQNKKFWQATNDVLRRHARFLCWYYAFTMLQAVLFGNLTSRWKRFKNSWWYGPFAERVLLPSISEWHVILTDFGIPTDVPREIQVDVLSTERILYKGKVGDYFLDAEGGLSGILLAEPYRFDREQYVRHKEEDLKLAVRSGIEQRRFSRKTSDYWKIIPSANLYLPGPHIANLNVRHEPVGTAAALAALNERLRGAGITLTEEPTTAESGPDDPVVPPHSRAR